MPEYHHQKLLPKITGNFSQFRNISARTSYSFFGLGLGLWLLLRRDRKACANNPSYRLPLSTKN